MPEILTIREYTNNALDKAYASVVNPMLKQIDALTKAPGSKLQRALKELEQEADRLEADGKQMKADNPVLKDALQTIEETFNAVSMLIQANDNQIESGASALAVPSVTASAFSRMADYLIKRGIDPVSQKALAFYREQIEKRGVKWLTN